jgi:uncharacterized protein YbjT (DUF2867 family)
MKTAIVLGANGLVGQELVKQLTQNSNYRQIEVLGRRKLDLIDDKIKYHSFDFNQPNLSLLNGDVLFCCLGTTIKKAGSQPEFKKVDYHYVIESAKAAFNNGTKSMVVISAMGADAHSSIFYNKVKGEMERDLSAIGFEKLIIVRPSLLLGHRSEFRLGERVAQVLVSGLNFLIPAKYKGIKAEQVAKAMINYESIASQPVAIYENYDLLKVNS